MFEMTRLSFRTVFLLATRIIPLITAFYLVGNKSAHSYIDNLMFFQLLYCAGLVLSIWVASWLMSRKISKAGGYVGFADTMGVPWALSTVLIGEPLLLLLFLPEDPLAGRYIAAGMLWFFLPMAAAHLEYTEREVSQKVIEPKEE